MICDHHADLLHRECPRCIAQHAAWFDVLGPEHAFTRAATPRNLWRGISFAVCAVEDDEAPRGTVTP